MPLFRAHWFFLPFLFLLAPKRRNEKTETVGCASLSSELDEEKQQEGIRKKKRMLAESGCAPPPLYFDGGESLSV